MLADQARHPGVCMASQHPLALGNGHEISNALGDHVVHRTKPAGVDEFLAAQDLDSVAQDRLPPADDIRLCAWSCVDVSQSRLSGHVHDIVTQAGREVDGQAAFERTVNHSMVGRNDHRCIVREFGVESLHQLISGGKCGTPPITPDPELMAGPVQVRPIDIRQ